MKFKNLTHRAARMVYSAGLLLAVCFISSCQKDSATNPETTTPSSSISDNNMSSLATTVKKHYTYTAPIYLINKSNMTISGDSIIGGSSVGIWLINCSNIHITKCKVMNSTKRAIQLNNCKNITVDSCYISNTALGITAWTGSGIRVMYNQILNMKGPSSSFVQFSGVTGAGNRICYNKCETVLGSGSNPNPGGGDGISLYQSYGTATDQIMVIGNWVRGGGTNVLGAGMSGIVAGDVGGAYQDIENNILVNTGYVGIQQQGGHHISIKNNKIYSDLLPWSAVGLCSANYSGMAGGSNTITGNQVNWHAGYNNLKQRDTSYKASNNPMPTGWKVNTVKATAITASILPAVMIKQPY